MNMNRQTIAIIAIVLGFLIVGAEMFLRKAQSQVLPDTGKIELTVPSDKSDTDAKKKAEDSDKTPEINPDEIKPDPSNNKRRQQPRQQPRRGQPNYSNPSCPTSPGCR